MVALFGLVTILGILGWGLYRSLSYGRLGLLAWLQFLALASPLVIFIGAFFFGIEINSIASLGLFLSAAGSYIWLGSRRRALDTTSSHPIDTDQSNPQTPDAINEVKNNKAVKDVITINTPKTAHAQSFSLNFLKTMASKPPINEASPGNGVDSESLPQKTDGTHSPLSSSVDPQTSVTNDSVVQDHERDAQVQPNNEETVPELPDVEVKSAVEKLSSSQRIPANDLQRIQTIFSIDTFFSTEHSQYYNGALFKGNLRGEPNIVHRTLSQRLITAVGLRYRLFLMADPQAKPIVLVFPTANDPLPSTWVQWLFATILFGVTVLTCMIAAAAFQGFDLLQNWERWPDTLFLAVGVVIILGAHELGHWVMAQRYHLRLSPPFFLPTWQIGSFGVFTRFESVVPHRTALFDVAFAGPAVGGGISLFMFVLGLYLSHADSLFQLSPIFFQSSILVGMIARVVLGDQFLQDMVDIDPLVIVGWLGLLITAINLMPVGQLDGGRIVQAIYGRKVIRVASAITLIVLAIATLFNPLALYWMVVILFLQRQLEQPQENELTEPNDTRAALGLLALFVMAAMLLPLSPALASRLGIGG